MAGSILSAVVLAGSKASKAEEGKNSITQVYIVTGVTDAAIDKPMAAIAVSGIPQIGESHPTYTTLKVISISSEPATEGSTEKWKVTVEYGISEEENVDTGSTVSFGGTVTTAETTKAFDLGGSGLFDKAIEVGTLDRDAQATPRDLPTTVPKQACLVSKFVPQFVLTATRRETSSPAAAAIAYVGKLNSASVTIQGQSYAARTLLCTRITGETSDNGDTYTVNYEFQYRPADDWKVECVAIDPESGAPYQNIKNIASGIVSFHMYDEVAFAGLNL